jgi:hypothetical protein
MSDVPIEWRYIRDVLADKLERYYEWIGKPKPRIAVLSTAGRLVREAAKLGIDPSTIDPEAIDSEAPLESWHRIIEERRPRDVLTSRADLLQSLLERELQTIDYAIEQLERVSHVEAAQRILTRMRLRRQFLSEEIQEAYRRYGSVEEVERRLPVLRKRAEERVERVVKELARGKRKADEKMRKLGVKSW